MNRDRSNWVINLHLVEEVHRVHDDDAANAADESGWEWIDGATWSGNCNESCESAVANHRNVRLAGLKPDRDR